MRMVLSAHFLTVSCARRCLGERSDMLRVLQYVLLGYAIFQLSKIAVCVLITLGISAAIFLVWFVGEWAWTEIAAIWRKYRRPDPPQAQPAFGRHWDVIARLEPFVNEKLEPAVFCGADAIDDPLHPHLSLVYVVGTRIRNRFWRTITVWRVSLLSGERWRAHNFNYIDRRPFVKTTLFRVNAFQSRNAIIIYVRNEKMGDLHPDSVDSFLYVYDIRYESAIEVRLRRSMRLGRYILPLAILCVNRRMKNGKFEAWRLRYVGIATKHEHGQMNNILVNALVEVSASKPQTSSIVHQEDLIVRYTSPPVKMRSEHKFGFYHRHHTWFRGFAYDVKRDRFEGYNSLFEFSNFDPPLKKFWRRYRTGISRYSLAISDREVVTTNAARTVLVRSRLQPPTLKMLAAEVVFKAVSMPRMDATKFRELTGVDLSGHFKR